MSVKIVLGIMFLLMGISQASCVDTKTNAIFALKRMQAKDYFDSEVQVRFAEAIAKGDEAEMQTWLEAGADVNAMGHEQMRPVFWALAKQSITGLEFLLRHGLDLNTAVQFPEDRRPTSLIEIGAGAEDSVYLRLFLQYGGNPNYQVSSVTGRTVIFEAVMGNRLENVRILSEAGADINHQDLIGQTPVVTAAAINNYDMVYYFLEKGADITLKNKWGKDLVERIKQFGHRGIRKGSEQYTWYLRVMEELEHRGVPIRDRTKATY